MNKKDAKATALKLVDVLATHEKTEVDDTEKDYKLKEGDSLEDFVPDKTEHHVYRFVGLGYALAGADKDQKKAKAQVVDVLARDLESGDLVISDTWFEENAPKGE